MEGDDGHRMDDQFLHKASLFGSNIGFNMRMDSRRGLDKILDYYDLEPCYHSLLLSGISNFAWTKGMQALSVNAMLCSAAGR